MVAIYMNVFAIGHTRSLWAPSRNVLKAFLYFSSSTKEVWQISEKEAKPDTGEGKNTQKAQQSDEKCCKLLHNDQKLYRDFWLEKIRKWSRKGLIKS